MMDRWLFHWPHSVWETPDAFSVLLMLLVHVIREPGAHSEEEHKKQTFHLSPKGAVSSDPRLPPHWDNLCCPSHCPPPTPSPEREPDRVATLKQGGCQLLVFSSLFSAGLSLPNCPIYSPCSLGKAWHSKQK